MQESEKGWCPFVALVTPKVKQWSGGTDGIEWFGTVDDLIYAIYDREILALRKG